MQQNNRNFDFFLCICARTFQDSDRRNTCVKSVAKASPPQPVSEDTRRFTPASFVSTAKSVDAVFTLILTSTYTWGLTRGSGTTVRSVIGHSLRSRHWITTSLYTLAFTDLSAKCVVRALMTELRSRSICQLIRKTSPYHYQAGIKIPHSRLVLVYFLVDTSAVSWLQISVRNPQSYILCASVLFGLCFLFCSNTSNRFLGSYSDLHSRGGWRKPTSRFDVFWPQPMREASVCLSLDMMTVVNKSSSISFSGVSVDAITEELHSYKSSSIFLSLHVYFFEVLHSCTAKPLMLATFGGSFFKNTFCCVLRFLN